MLKCINSNNAFKLDNSIITKTVYWVLELFLLKMHHLNHPERPTDPKSADMSTWQAPAHIYVTLLTASVSQEMWLKVVKSLLNLWPGKDLPLDPESATGKASTRSVSSHAGRTELRQSQKHIVEFVSKMKWMRDA